MVLASARVQCLSQTVDSIKLTAHNSEKRKQRNIEVTVMEQFGGKDKNWLEIYCQLRIDGKFQSNRFRCPRIKNSREWIIFFRNMSSEVALTKYSLGFPFLGVK